MLISFLLFRPLYQSLKNSYSFYCWTFWHKTKAVLWYIHFFLILFTYWHLFYVLMPKQIDICFSFAILYIFKFLHASFADFYMIFFWLYCFCLNVFFQPLTLRIWLSVSFRFSNIFASSVLAIWLLFITLSLKMLNVIF